MFQDRKKDFLQRLIEEFFKKLNELVNGKQALSDSERKSVLNDCFQFFSDNFGVSAEDNDSTILEKVRDVELLEQYAKLLLIKYEIADIKEKEQLLTALSIVEYVQKTDNTYSWERNILHEDILRLIDSNT